VYIRANPSLQSLQGLKETKDNDTILNQTKGEELKIDGKQII